MSVPREKIVDIFLILKSAIGERDMPRIMPKAKTQVGPKLDL